MKLNRAFARTLKAKAHSLNPVVMLGQHGLTEAVHAEIDNALTKHELIKIRVNAEDRTVRQQYIEQIVAQHQAELIQTIGHIMVIYRKRPD